MKGWDEIMEITDAIAEYDATKIADEAEFKQRYLGRFGQNLNTIINGFSKDPLAAPPEPAPPTSSIIANYSGLKIALAGRSHSGKTTITNALMDLGVVDREYLFAGQLKAGLEVMGVTRDHPHFREFAQVVGTEVLKKYNPYHWIKQLTIEVENDLGHWGTAPLRGFVISDARFGAEMSWCLVHNFSVFYLDTSDEELKRRGSTVDTTHASEQIPQIKGVHTIRTDGNSPRAIAAAIIYTSLMNQDDGVV